METLIQDIRYGIRTLIKKPAFTAVVVAALALGIGANTAIFSIVNSILLRPLPYKDPDRLAMIWMDNKRMNVDQDIHSFANYLDYRDQNQVFESMAAYSGVSLNLVGSGEPPPHPARRRGRTDPPGRRLDRRTVHRRPPARHPRQPDRTHAAPRRTRRRQP